MTVRDFGEYELVRRLSNRLQQTFGINPHVLASLDDDAAIVENDGVKLVLTVDNQFEDIHFRRRWMPPFDLGWKAIAISLSDIAAMGARPLATLLSIGLTGDETVSFVDAIYDGAVKLCQQTKTLLLGGDTVRSPNGLLISSIAIGTLTEEPLCRSGAQIGDAIIVTGFIGQASAGLFLLEKDYLTQETENNESVLSCIHHFLCPIPRTEIVPTLRRFAVHSAIDLSDGLVADAKRMAIASKVQIAIELESVPLSKELQESAALVGKDALVIALTGGEDYELLLAVHPKDVVKLCRALSELNVPAHVIGRVEEGAGQVIGIKPDGQRISLTDGFQHFYPSYTRQGR